VCYVVTESGFVLRLMLLKRFESQCTVSDEWHTCCIVLAVAHTAGVPAASLAALFLSVQSLFDASSFNCQTDCQQYLQVHWSVADW